MSFVLVGNRLVNTSSIKFIDLANIENLDIAVHYDTYIVSLSGIQAIDLLMALKPSSLEGRKLRWAKRAWMFHNLVAHPAMQLLALCKLPKFGIWLHDVTVPKPRGKKKHG